MCTTMTIARHLSFDSLTLGLHPPISATDSSFPDSSPLTAYNRVRSCQRVGIRLAILIVLMPLYYTVFRSKLADCVTMVTPYHWVHNTHCDYTLSHPKNDCDVTDRA